MFGAQTNFSDKMKKITNILLIISGLILSPWAIYQWSLIGFQIEPKFYAGNRDGSFFLILTLIGICIISYGLWNLIVLQKKLIHRKLFEIFVFFSRPRYIYKRYYLLKVSRRTWRWRNRRTNAGAFATSQLGR